MFKMTATQARKILADQDSAALKRSSPTDRSTKDRRLLISWLANACAEKANSVCLKTSFIFAHVTRASSVIPRKEWTMAIVDV